MLLYEAKYIKKQSLFNIENNYKFDCLIDSIFEKINFAASCGRWDTLVSHDSSLTNDQFNILISFFENLGYCLFHKEGDNFFQISWREK
jgi:hypothetical protein